MRRAATLLAGAVAACLLGAAAPDGSTLRPPAVTVVAAARGTVVDTAVLTGTLVPREEVLVSPQLDGLAVTEILAEEGDRVATGQVLARLSRDLLDTSLAQNAAAIARADAATNQARAQIGEAQAVRTQSDQALARTRDLIASGAASRETLEARQAAALTGASRATAAENFLHIAEADRASAEAQRRELLVRLQRTDLRAPVAGIVSRRTARLGGVVSASGEPLFRVIAAGQIELEADVPETQLARLQPGQAARISAGGSDRGGQVRLVSPEVSRNTRLGRVRIGVDGGALVIGAFARATVEIARHDGIVAPLSAVLTGPDGAVVQVVRDGVVETRRVLIGLRDSTVAEIVDGLQPGEQIVAVSGTFVRQGDQVTPIPAPARTVAGG